MPNMLKTRAKRFSSQSRILYVAEYEPGLYIGFIRHLGVLEDGIACVDPDHPCNKRWLIPTDAEECGTADIIVVWDPVNLLACAEGYCYASIFGVGNEFGPYDTVVKRVESMNQELARAVSELGFMDVKMLYLPTVRVEECRGRVVELCSTSCNVVLHLDCKTVDLDAYIGRDSDLAICAKCDGACPSECTSVTIDVLKLAREYVAANQRNVKAKAFYDRNTLVALISGYGVLALISGGEMMFGSIEEVATWLSDRGRQYIADLILREGGLVDNG